MRKLFALFLCATFVFGQAAIFQLEAAAKSRADEQADALLRQARAAIGGDDVINAVQNLLINGNVNHRIKLPDGTEKTFDGNIEMALEVSGRLQKRITPVDAPAGAASENGKRIFRKEVETMVRREAGNGGEPVRVEKFHKRINGHHGNDLARLVFGLLLKTSPALDAIYNYAGEGDVDGTRADIIEARNSEGFAVKLYLDKSSHLPLMMSYRATKMQHMFVIRKDGEPSAGREEKDVIVLRGMKNEGDKVIAAPNGETKVFVRKKDENGNVTTSVQEGAMISRAPLEEAEFQVRFGDYRTVGGLLLPHRMTESVNGQTTEVITIGSYQVNAPNIADKFRDNVRVFRKTQEN